MVLRGVLVVDFTRYLPGPAPVGTGVDAATAKLHAQQIAGYYDVSRAAVSNFMSLVYLLGEVKVVVNQDGTISVPMLAGYSGAPKKWREISPYVWQDTASNDRLAAKVVNGQIVRFTAEPIAAIESFERAPWWTTAWPSGRPIPPSSRLVRCCPVTCGRIGTATRSRSSRTRGRNASRIYSTS